MRALTWQGRHDVRVEAVPDPQIINPRDAIIEITSTAICGSDLHLYDHYIPTMKAGDVLGHEFMGIVAEVGPGNRELKVGQRVLFAKYAGTEIKIDGTEYLILRESDVMGIVE